MPREGSKRFAVRFGDEVPLIPVRAIPRDDVELLQRSMALLEELFLADFMPQEFHDEYRALLQASAK